MRYQPNRHLEYVHLACAAVVLVALWVIGLYVFFVVDGPIERSTKRLAEPSFVKEQNDD